MTIMSPAVRGRSLAAMQLQEARIRAELTYEDMGERYHAWWHAWWLANLWRADELDARELNRCLTHHCRDHREQGPRTMRRLERLTQTTYDKNPRKWSGDLRTFRFLAEVAHADADIEDVFEACFVEVTRARAAEMKRRGEERMRLAQDLADHVRSGRVDQLSQNDDYIEAIALRILAADRKAAA
ncbi:hypothetical protein [Microbacterium lacus]|uniref:hypothetical protein n=1 Tax=Microbacterium lacus TaxID=415217 RepID=UPI000C2C59B5|nr:hypothetical protein [Microbacterium lacus]